MSTLNEIRFPCAGCGIELAATEDIIGVHVRCDSCNTKQEVVVAVKPDVETKLTNGKSKAKKFSAPKKERRDASCSKKQRKQPAIILSLLAMIVGCGFFLSQPEGTSNPQAKLNVNEGHTVNQAPKPVASHTIHKSVNKFINKYCLDCHNGDKQKGDVQLDNLSVSINNNSIAQQWQDILDVLNTGDMPPRKATQPPKEELSEAIGKLTEELLTARKVLTDQGGEIVVRRLNKLEYINTVKAVTGITIPTKLVPDDADSGEYNTMGANQYFPPSLIVEHLRPWLAEDSLHL